MQCKCGASTIEKDVTKNGVIVMTYHECRVCKRVGNRKAHTPPVNQDPKPQPVGQADFGF